MRVQREHYLMQVHVDEGQRVAQHHLAVLQNAQPVFLLDCVVRTAALPVQELVLQELARRPVPVEQRHNYQHAVDELLLS